MFRIIDIIELPKRVTCQVYPSHSFTVETAVASFIEKYGREPFDIFKIVHKTLGYSDFYLVVDEE